jgi:hypothetical protein
VSSVPPLRANRHSLYSQEDHFDGQGTLKVERVVPGAVPDEVMVPLQVQSDFWRIHLRAGFGNDPH